MSDRNWSDAWNDLTIENRFTDELPGDPDPSNVPRQVDKACYSRVQPKPVSQPRLIALSDHLRSELGLPESLVRSQEFADVFSGNAVHPSMDPYAMCYGGHQFGSWAGQLGDGRAINLCELVDQRDQLQTLQLKGAGPTPYSRFADGLAVLRSSIREFLCSEAMYHLGVPTTRALSLMLTGDSVMRDMFYDGNPKAEPGAVVCRVAPSFLRLGNFQLFASRDDVATLKQLGEFTLKHHFSHLGEPSPDVYAEFFSEVCRRTASLMVHWMRVGFVHGVMNTDNLSIHGLTIDYGPYGWLEDYDPDWTPNTTDASTRRYRYGNQPHIAQWNLAQFAGALLPLVDNDIDRLQGGLAIYVETFEQQWRDMMAAKLGLDRYSGSRDDQLFADLFELLQMTETDMTLFYRRLAEVPCSAPIESICEQLSEAYYRPDQIDSDVRQATERWFENYRRRVAETGISDDQRRTGMNQVNPIYVLRNYLAQLAIDRSEQGDHSGISELLEVLRHPYDQQSGLERFSQKRPDWARHRAGCSMLSCSS